MFTKFSLIVLALALSVSIAFTAGFFAGGSRPAQVFTQIHARPLCDAHFPDAKQQYLDERGICRAWTSNDEIAAALKN